MKGLTGNITFDQHGLRTDFELEVIELKKEGLVKVGAWTEKGGMNFTRNFTWNSTRNFQEFHLESPEFHLEFH